MPKIISDTKPVELQQQPLRTVISVSHTPIEMDQRSENGNGGRPRGLVDRTLSHRSSVVNFVKSNQSTQKLGHRRVHDDGEVTYKKFHTTQLMGSIQLGLHYVLSNETDVPERDILFPDFLSIETIYFARNGLLQKTPAHNFSEFRFRIYAAYAFRIFRQMFEIDSELFHASLCSEPMVELSAAGASGSIFYVTRDDNFICKTVQHKEAEFLQKLLPGYYMNLKQNPRTLLPKFFGLYCYSCNAKNVRILVMNNLLPSGLKMHQKFDLKGSTYKRKASKKEKAKANPTYKDLDFMDMHPDGIVLQPDLYQSLMNSIQRDCRVLESFKIMDYSLLIGIHNVDQASREKDADNDLPGQQQMSAPSDGDSSSTGTAGNQYLDRQGSFQGRERMIAHSTALESITVEVDSLSLAGVGGASATNTSCHQVIDDDLEGSTDYGINNVWGGIPAKNKKGENLLLFIGIIDILQSYRTIKKLEHFWKSLIHDGDTVSVHRPGFYAKRFQAFLSEKVFKKALTPQEGRRGTSASFRRGNLRRTYSKEHEPLPTPDVKKESGVTVIRIGDSNNEVNLPYVLQDRGKASSLVRQSSSNVMVVNADIVHNSIRENELNPSPDVISSPELKNILRLKKGDHDETGSVITMTSDERVQIFVPSPQGTPYNTINAKSASTTMSIGSANLVPLFNTHRMPLSESYRSLTPLNMSTTSPAREITETTIVQETSLEMIRISLVSTSSEDKTIPVDLESLPLDQPVSLSHVHLEGFEAN